MAMAVIAALLPAPADAPRAEESGMERERAAATTRPAESFSRPEPYERRPGGAATVFKAPNRNAFSHPSANMPFERALDFRVGDGIFRKVWVSAPSSTVSSDGLGPLFNARSCQRCHLKDGRGHPPAAGERAESMLLRLSIPSRGIADRTTPGTYREASIAEPAYGDQLQNFSVQGVRAEGDMAVAYREMPMTLAGGEEVSLRAPRYEVANPRYGPLHPDTMISPRGAALFDLLVFYSRNLGVPARRDIGDARVLGKL